MSSAKGQQEVSLPGIEKHCCCHWDKITNDRSRFLLEITGIWEKCFYRFTTGLSTSGIDFCIYFITVQPESDELHYLFSMSVYVVVVHQDNSKSMCLLKRA